MAADKANNTNKIDEGTRSRRLIRGEGGQSAVEFALLMPLFLVIFMVIVNFGFVFSTWINMNHAAREGARAAAVGSNETQVRSRVTSVAAFVDPDDVTLQYVDRNGGDSYDIGDSVVVRVTHTIDLIMPAILGLDPSLTLTACADMRLEQNVSSGTVGTSGCD